MIALSIIRPAELLQIYVCDSSVPGDCSVGCYLVTEACDIGEGSSRLDPRHWERHEDLPAIPSYPFAPDVVTSSQIDTCADRSRLCELVDFFVWARGLVKSFGQPLGR